MNFSSLVNFKPSGTFLSSVFYARKVLIEFMILKGFLRLEQELKNHITATMPEFHRITFQISYTNNMYIRSYHGFPLSILVLDKNRNKTITDKKQSAYEK